MKPRLQQLEGKYSGNRCFIMGNGPSLNKMDLKLLKDEYVWGSNKIYLLFNRISWRPQFYTAVDVRVVPDIADEIDKIAQMMPNCLFFIPLKFRTDCVLKSRKNLFWIPEVQETDTFSFDISKWVASVRTVTITALQLAVYLGFNPIYLIGCDTSYSVPKTVVYENDNPNQLISTVDDDYNHFDPSYFGEGSKWHEPHVDRMINHYKISKKYCDQKNVKIINATVGGNLEVFPRENYNDLFK